MYLRESPWQKALMRTSMMRHMYSTQHYLTDAHLHTPSPAPPLPPPPPKKNKQIRNPQAQVHDHVANERGETRLTWMAERRRERRRSQLYTNQDQKPGAPK
jgi:hypothetical protein